MLSHTDGSGMGEPPDPHSSSKPKPQREEVGRDPIPLLHPPAQRGMMAVTETGRKQHKGPNLGLAQSAASGGPAAFPSSRTVHIRARLFVAILWLGPTAGLQRSVMCWGSPRAQQVKDMRFLFIYHSLARRVTIEQQRHREREAAWKGRKGRGGPWNPWEMVTQQGAQSTQPLFPGDLPPAHPFCTLTM